LTGSVSTIPRRGVHRHFMTARHHIWKVSVDNAYGVVYNLQAIDRVGAKAFIPHKAERCNNLNVLRYEWDRNPYNGNLTFIVYVRTTTRPD
jgi:hypothetical protein